MHVYVLHHSCNSSMRAELCSGCTRCESKGLVLRITPATPERAVRVHLGLLGTLVETKKTTVHKLPLSVIGLKLQGASNVLVLQRDK